MVNIDLEAIMQDMLSIQLCQLDCGITPADGLDNDSQIDISKMPCR
jgi:hypothetical protein